jgi:PEGA domain
MGALRQVFVMVLVFGLAAAAQDKPRVFMAGHGTTNGMTKGAVGGTRGGGGWWAAGRTDSIVDSHDESMELAKDFAQSCPGVQVTVNAEAADYVTSLNRESKAKKGLFSKNDQIMVSNKAGDVLLSSTVRSVATAAKDACNVITSDFAAHGHAKTAATAQPAATPAKTTPAEPKAEALSSASATGSSTELAISSSPDGADIELDGKFVGNSPSSITVPNGDHMIVVRMVGRQSWKRTISTSGGKVNLNAILPNTDATESNARVVPASSSLGDAARAARTRHAQQDTASPSGSTPQ